MPNPANRRSSNPNDAFTWEACAPADGGFTQVGLVGMRDAIRREIDRQAVLGVVLTVIRHNRLVMHEAQGFRDPAARHALGRDDLFRMMSSTKSVTATAVLMMQDEGKLSIDDPVARFLPRFRNQQVAIVPPGTTDPSAVRLVPAHRDITLRDLLTHTAGLSTSGLGGMTVASLVNRVERRPGDTLAAYVDRLGGIALDFQPGSRWSYSPTEAFDTLLRIVEVTSGQPADRFLAERLFQPLGMTATCFDVPPASRERIVPLYQRVDGAWREIPSIFGDDPPTHISGAGNLFSTARDFARYELMLLNRGSLNGRRILSAESVALMSTNQVGSLFADVYPEWTAGHGFGLGVAIVADRERGQGREVGAFGWGGAYGTVSWTDPALDLVVVTLVQQPGANLMGVLAPAVRDAIASRD